MAKVYVACKFRPNDRSYTYEWDGEPLRRGDIVKVPTRSGDGWQRATVDYVSDQAPPFACKPILGIFNPDVEPDPPLKAAEPATDLLGDDNLPFA